MPLCEPRCAVGAHSPRNLPPGAGIDRSEALQRRRVPRGDGVLRRAPARGITRRGRKLRAPMVGGLSADRSASATTCGSGQYSANSATDYDAHGASSTWPYTSRCRNLTRACQVQREAPHVAGRITTRRESLRSVMRPNFGIS